MMENIKRKLLIICSLSVLLSLVVFSMLIQYKDSINTVCFVLEAIDGDMESISLFENNGKYYAFLPSSADLKKASLNSNKGYKITIDNKAYTNQDYCCELETNREYAICLYDFLGFKIAEKKLIILKASNVPSLSLQLSDGVMREINSNKEISKSGIAKLIKEDGIIDYSGSFKSFHGRGNSSWLGEKKPYCIEFEDDTSLLGMNKGKKYNLIANCENLRNKIVLDSALNTDIKSPINSEFIDLFINDEYYGLYLLTESIEIGNDRLPLSDLSAKTQEVNRLCLKQYPTFEIEEERGKLKGYSIPQSPNDITGSYIFEMDYPSRGYQDHDSAIVTKSSICFNIWSPKYASYEEVSYALDYLNDVETEIKGGKINEVIDVNSFVDYYLIQELFANTDDASFFFYKQPDNNHLYAGPAWDFDLSLYESIYEISVDPACSIKTISENTIFHYLFANQDFSDAVKDRYKDFFCDEIEDVYHCRIYQYQERIHDSSLMSFIRWHTSASDDVTLAFENETSENVKGLCRFLEHRNSAFIRKWIEGQKDCTIQLLSYSGVRMRKYISVYYGKALDEPEPQCDGYQFLGFYNKKTNEKLDHSKPIYEDGTYIAKWEVLGNTSGNDEKNALSLRQKLKKVLNINTVMIICLIIIALISFVFIVIDILRIKKVGIKKDDRKH